MSSFGLKPFYVDSKGGTGFPSKLIFDLIKLNPVAIGTLEIPELQQDCAIAIGKYAGFYFQGTCAIALGEYAGHSLQSQDAVAIGSQAGEIAQGLSAIAIGSQAAAKNQSSGAIAIGVLAGQNSQASQAIAIGTNAGQNSQRNSTVAIGYFAGQNSQQERAIAIGSLAGQSGQQTHAVAVGVQAGQYSQGQSAIAIGYYAGITNQPANSIIINASGAALSGTDQLACYIHPIRQEPNLTSLQPQNLLYNSTTKELTHQPNPITVGDLKYSAQSTDHNSWLLCDGRSLSTVTYAKLFAVIGYAFGGAAGSFNLPDPRSRVLGAIGPGGGSLSARALGAAVGAETHTLSVTEMPGHTHTGTTDPAGWAAVSASPAVSLTTMDVADDSGDHTHTFTTNSTGGDQAHNNMQPTLFVGNVFIYAGL